MTAKSAYRSLCESEESVPFFSQAWWLDAVCGTDGWDACVVEKGGKLLAAMPYYTKSKFGFRILSQPMLTQTMGPWIRTIDGKYSSRLGQEKELMLELIQRLPSFDYFRQSWHHSIKNWLPFHWAGFRQTTRYTYLLPDITDQEAIWNGFQENARREIRKARDRFKLVVSNNFEVSDFLDLNSKTFGRQSRSLPYSKEFVENLDKACSQRCCRAIYIAVDESGNHHAGCYIVWWGGVAYYLMGGSNPDFRSSGAGSLCLWTAIQHASKVANSFDFEGSMIEPIERHFRSFGAQQIPYHQVSKSNSKLISLALALNELR